MNETLDVRRILIYLIVAFGAAWAGSLVVYLTGGLADSPVLIPDTGITLALALMATVVMWSPGLAHVLTRLITREGWQNVYLRPRLKRGWPYWLMAWFLPGLLIIAGAALYFWLFPATYDPELTRLRALIQRSLPQGIPAPLNMWAIAAAQVVQALALAPIINGWATFGEEFGWRGYLQPKLMPLGGRRAMVVMGLIWGVWHWPVILMGHNYGLAYPGAPFLGPLVMIWFTFTFGTFLGWLTLRGGSVWPAVIGHAAANGMAALGFIFVQGEPNPLLGPAAVGLIGGIGFTIVTLLILLSPQALSEPPKHDEAPKTEIVPGEKSQAG